MEDSRKLSKGREKWKMGWGDKKRRQGKSPGKAQEATDKRIFLRKPSTA